MPSKKTQRTEWSAQRRADGGQVVGYIMISIRISPRDEDGYFVGQCEELGVSGFGDTVDAAVADTLTAVEAYLEELDGCDELESAFKDRGVTFTKVEPADDDVQPLHARPGEFVSPQRLSGVLIDA